MTKGNNCLIVLSLFHSLYLLEPSMFQKNMQNYLFYDVHKYNHYLHLRVM